MKKFLKSFFLIFISVLLSACLASCSSYENSSSESEKNVSAESVDAISSLPFVISEGYKMLHTGPDGTFLIYVAFSEEAADFTDNRKILNKFQLFVVDQNTLSLISEKEFSYNAEDSSVCIDFDPRIYYDDTFAIKEISSDFTDFTFYNSSLEKVGSLRYPYAGEVFLSYDKSTFYFSDSFLEALPVGSTKKIQIPLPEKLHILSVSGFSSGNILSMTLFPENDTAATYFALFDLNQMQFLCLTDMASDFSGDNDSLCIQIIQGNHQGIYLRQDQKLYKTGLNSLCSYSVSADGNVLFPSCDPSESSSFQFYLFGFSGPALVYSLAEYPIIQSFDEAIYIESRHSLIVTVENQDSLTDLLIIDLSLLPCTALRDYQNCHSSLLIDSSLIENAILSGPVLSDDLQNCRKKADEMEERFGITILLSSESDYRSQQGGFTSHSTYSTTPDDESEILMDALESLNEFLSLFPDDFFTRFCQGPENGFCFMPVGSIESTFHVIAYERYDSYFCQYELVYDCDYPSDITQTLSHEIWHAIEDCIGCFPYEEWESLNPDGFTYIEVYEGYQDIVDEQYIWKIEDPVDVYFIDKYSKSYAVEDRARIFEYFFSQKSYQDSLQSCPHLVQKYQFLQQCIYEFFGYQLIT